MSITEKTAQHIAYLSRLDHKDVEALYQDFNKVIALFETIETVKVDNIQIESDIHLSLDSCRSDVVSNPALDLATFSYSGANGLIRVPKIIE